VTGDEVYGGGDLRRAIRALGMGYVLAVRANHGLTPGSGRVLTAAGAVRHIPRGAWQRMRTGHGTTGSRQYDWAMLEVTSDDAPGDRPAQRDAGRSVLLVRRHRYTGTCSFYRCWTPGPVPLTRLIAIAVTRWRIEVGHRWCRSSRAAFSWLCSLLLVRFVLGLCPAGAGVEAGRACPAFA
jgi:hypothetical protein